MYSIKEVARLTGVSARTLRHYDTIGLLKATRNPENDYRLYSQKDLERLQLILFFRELQFPLKDIPVIIDAPDFDRNRALEQQAELLTLKKRHLENLITLARGASYIGVKHMKLNKTDYENWMITPHRPRPCGGKLLPIRNIWKNRRTGTRKRKTNWAKG